MSLLEIEVTCPDSESATIIAKACLRARLIACANLLPQVESLFFWQGQVDSESETLLRMKTRETLFDEICALVKEHHPYELPAIIAYPVTQAGPGVADWVGAETQPAKICD